MHTGNEQYSMQQETLRCELQNGSSVLCILHILKKISFLKDRNTDVSNLGNKDEISQKNTTANHTCQYEGHRHSHVPYNP